MLKSAAEKIRPIFVSLTTVWVCICILHHPAAAAHQQAEKPATATEQEPALEGLRQPGDDITFELRDESDKIDPQNQEALSWYMAGLLAQKKGDLRTAADAFEKSAAAAPKAASPLKALGLVLLRMGQPDQGIKRSLEAIELDKNDHETRLQLALWFASNNRPDKAGELITDALQSRTLNRKSREFITLHQVRARLLLAGQNIKAAADSYAVLFEALERPEDFGLSFRDHQALLKDRASGYDAAGRVLLEAGRTDLAIQVFEALNRVENNRPGDHHLPLARAYFMKDDLQACETSLDRYFETGRRDNAAIQLLKDLYEATSRSDQLIARLETLAEGANDTVRVRMSIAQVLLDRGETDKAADIYQALLDDSGEVDAYLGLMRVEIIRRNAAGLIATMNRAVRARIQAVELLPLIAVVLEDQTFGQEVVAKCEEIRAKRPNDLAASVTYFCARVARDVGQSEKEGELLKATLEMNPEPALAAQALEEYGFNLLSNDKFAEAARTYSQLVSLPGLNLFKRLEGLYRLSQAESFNENYPAALEAIRLAVRLGNDQIPSLRYQLGWVLIQADQFDEAEKVLESCVRDFAGDPDTHSRSRFLLAALYAQQSRWADAIKQYEGLIEDEKTDPDMRRRCRMGLSNAYLLNGDPDKSEKILEAVYEEDPTDVGVNNDLGYLYADHGKNLEQAEMMIRLAVAAQPDNPAYLDSLGWVLFKQGRFEEALVELKKANSDPEYRDATLLEHMGDVHEALNQTADARKAWQEALNVEQNSTPGDPAIIERLKSKLKNSDPEQNQ